MQHETINTSLNDSFICLYNQYKQKMYCQAFYMTCNPDQAEDIVQDVFLNLWKNKDRWEHIENIPAFLFLCTRNKTLDYIRKARREQALVKELKESELLYDSPELKLELQEAWKLHEEAVRRLPQQQKMVYTLVRLHRYKRKEVARELCISDNTVRYHMQVAIRSIKRYILSEVDNQDCILPEGPGRILIKEPLS